MAQFHVVGVQGSWMMNGVDSLEDISSSVEKHEGIPTDDQLITIDGKHIRTIEDFKDLDFAHDFLCARILLRLSGGKGGFGSLLRHQNTQVGARKVTNTDAMRDLHGRRMRHVNAAERLAEFEKRKREEEEEKREKKRLKVEKESQMFQFDAEKYTADVKEVRDKTTEAVHDVLNSNPETLKTSLIDTSQLKNGKEEIKTNDVSHMWDDFDDYMSDDNDVDSVEENPIPTCDSRRAIKIQSISPPEKVSAALPSTTTTTVTSHTTPTPSTTTQIDTTPPLPSATTTTSSHTTASTSDREGPQKETPCDSIGINIENLGEVAQLEAYGLDALKAELQRRGLKCGGSLAERAERLWLVRGVPATEIDASLRAGSKKPKKPHTK